MGVARLSVGTRLMGVPVAFIRGRASICPAPLCVGKTHGIINPVDWQLYSSPVAAASCVCGAKLGMSNAAHSRQLAPPLHRTSSQVCGCCSAWPGRVLVRL